jgi:hypothetical protein
VPIEKEDASSHMDIDQEPPVSAGAMDGDLGNGREGFGGLASAKRNAEDAEMDGDGAQGDGVESVKRRQTDGMLRHSHKRDWPDFHLNSNSSHVAIWRCRRISATHAQSSCPTHSLHSQLAETLLPIRSTRQYQTLRRLEPTSRAKRPDRRGIQKEWRGDEAEDHGRCCRHDGGHEVHGDRDRNDMEDR